LRRNSSDRAILSDDRHGVERMGREDQQRSPGQVQAPLADTLAGSLFARLPWLELGLAASTVAMVVGGAAYLVVLLVQQEVPKNIADFSAQFEGALSALMLLVVGVSMAAMLLMRKPENVIDIMLFVVARSVLIRTHGGYGLLFAVAAVAGLLAARKYLIGLYAKPPNAGG